MKLNWIFVFLKINELNIFKKISFFLSPIFLVVFFIFPFKNYSQNKASSYKTITASFSFQDVVYEDVAVITNVLKVKNNNGKNYTFTITVNTPSNWKSLIDSKKEYNLMPNDSVYIPVRIITSNKKVKGGTKYSISAYINTNEGKQMAFARFTAGRPKVTNWQMHILPRPRIYFLNGENTSSFQLNISNEGDESQELLINMQKIGKDLYLTDTLGKRIKKEYFELKLPPFTDTTYSYNVSTSEEKINQKRVDTWGYNPFSLEKEKRFGLFIRGSEVSSSKANSSLKSKKVDFVKLANNIDFVKLNNSTIAGSGSNKIPLTTFLNVTNIMGFQPAATLLFFGNSEIGKYSNINYNIQTSASYFKYSNSFYTQNLGGNITLNHKNAIYGFSTGGTLLSYGSAKSLFFGYNLFKRIFLTFNYSRARLLGPSSFNVFGVGFNTNIKRVNINAGYNIGLRNGFKPDYVYRLGLNYRLTNWYNQQLFYFHNRLWLNQGDFIDNINYQIGQSFNFKKLRFNLNYNNRFLSNSLTNNKFYNNTIFLNASYILKSKYNFLLNSNLNTNNNSSFLPSLNVNNLSFINVLTFSKIQRRNTKLTSSQGIFFNYNKFNLDTIISSGLQINLGQSNYENNFFAAGNMRFGYNKLLTKNYFNSPAVFFLQSNVTLRYKVWNIMAMYNYGSISLVESSRIIKGLVNNFYPQSFRINLSHQLQLKQYKKFILENNFVYFYMNTIKSNSISLFSQLFYYTKNYTRFGLNLNYNFNSSSGTGNLNLSQSAFLNQAFNSNEQKKNKSQAIFFGFNVKKDLFIPIPKRFRNTKYCDAKFVVFLDINGNKIKDENEVPVENVVLRMNDYEVITDATGSANFINISFAKYRIQVLPLIDMGAWFPNVGDSLEVCGPEPIYLPFSKGVQVYGNVELDRELQSSELYQKLDVSRFKLYLTDSTGKVYSTLTDNNGNFSFYVPYERYILHFDEKVLGSSFYLPDNDIDLDLRSGIESYYHHFLIIEKKRKIKKKIFGPDGKITYVEEEAGSKKSDKDKKAEKDEKNKNIIKSGDDVNKDGKSGSDGMNGMISFEAKFKQLDSLLEVLNRMIARAATKPDVRFIVHQEIQLLIEELNATFTIVIDELPKGKNPTGILLQLVRMKKVQEKKLNNGKKLYFSGDYKEITEAEKFCRDFQSSGFRKAKVVKRNDLIKREE